MGWRHQREVRAKARALGEQEEGVQEGPGEGPSEAWSEGDEGHCEVREEQDSRKMMEGPGTELPEAEG